MYDVHDDHYLYNLKYNNNLTEHYIIFIDTN